MNKFIQAYNTKFSLCPCPKNLSQNSSNNITNYLHYPKFYKPPTLSKLHHDKKKKKKKKYNTSKMLQNQHYNMINHTMPQIPTRSHNKMTMSHHQTFNEAWSNTFPNKKKPKKNSPWSPFENMEHGSWGLEGSPPHHSIQMMDDISCHEKWEKRVHWKKVTFWCNEKMGLKVGFTKNGCVAKVLKNTRI